MTAGELIEEVRELRVRIADIKTQVISLRIEITDMTNGHGIAFANLQDKYDSLIRKINPKEK